MPLSVYRFFNQTEIESFMGIQVIRTNTPELKWHNTSHFAEINDAIEFIRVCLCEVMTSIKDVLCFGYPSVLPFNIET